MRAKLSTLTLLLLAGCGPSQFEQRQAYWAAREAQTNAALQRAHEHNIVLLNSQYDCWQFQPVRIGWSAAQLVKSCWGQPNRVHELVTDSGLQEQWVYLDMAGGNAHYVYLKDGRVTATQN